MKTIKSFGFMVSMILMSLSCFAGTRFYCPDPSSMHAQGTTESYKYIGTNENGIVFESGERITGDVKKAPTLTAFYSAMFFVDSDWSASGSVAICTYRDSLGHGVMVKDNAHSSFKPVGDVWLWSAGEDKQAICSLSNRQDCAFEFDSQ